MVPLSTFGQHDSLRTAVVSQVRFDLQKHYIDSRLSRMAGDSVWERYTRGMYPDTLNYDEFLFRITQDLRCITKDMHIKFFKSLDEPIHPSPALLTPKGVKKFRKRREIDKRRKHSIDQFHYGEIKILPGNIGYIEINAFDSRTSIRKTHGKRITFEQVLEFTKKTQALIFDFRNHSGGLSQMAIRFCSYFTFPRSYFMTEQSVIRYDSSGYRQQLIFVDTLYTDSSVTDIHTNGKRLFFLTSDRTFSAGELAIYKVLKYRPDAIIIGAHTRGNVNGVRDPIVNKFYAAFIPYFQMYDQTNANFSLQGKGLSPDYLVVENQAFDTAYKMALTQVDISDKRVVYFPGTRGATKQAVQDHDLKQYSGFFRKASIFFQDNKLYIVYGEFMKRQLLPVKPDHFKAEGFDSIRFLRNDSGVIDKIQIFLTPAFVEVFNRVAEPMTCPISRQL